MDDDQLEQAGSDAAPTNKTDDGDDRKLAYRERDAAKKRARDAEKRAAELEAKLAERQAADETAAAEVERKKNDFAALETRLKKERDAIAQKAQELESRLQARERADRESALVDAVAKKLGGGYSSIAIKGVLRVFADDGAVDIAPEQLDDKLVADAAKRAREVLGDLPAKNTGSPGTPGVNLDTKPPREKPGADPARERVQELARRMSFR